MKALFEYKGCGEIRQTHNLINELMDRKICEMKEVVENQCRSILIANGFALETFTAYQWRRLGKLLESREDGITYYLGEDREIKVYQVTYYEPPMPSWTNPEFPYTIQLGAYHVKSLL